jgi:hypothetical protein
MIRFQNFSHYKLPITIDPLKYGKLLDQSNNKFIIQLTTKNIAVINQYNKENFVRIFKNGDLVLEFNDKILDEKTFIRTIYDTKFTFENERLILTQVSTTAGLISIYIPNDLTPFIPTPNIGIIYSFLYLNFLKNKLSLNKLGIFLVNIYLIIVILLFISLVFIDLYFSYFYISSFFSIESKVDNFVSLCTTIPLMKPKLRKIKRKV